jgi:hypothetical protein
MSLSSCLQFSTFALVDKPFLCSRLDFSQLLFRVVPPPVSTLIGFAAEARIFLFSFLLCLMQEIRSQYAA